MGGDSFLGTTRRKVTLALVLLALVVFGIFVWQAVTASRALVDARTEAEKVQTLVRAGDFQGAAAELKNLQDSTHQAHSATKGILWDIGRHIPYLGRNIGAVQTVSAVLDTVTAQNGPVALNLSNQVQAGRFKPVNGRFDLALVQQLTPEVTRAAQSIDQAASDLQGVRADRLLFPFNDLVGDLQTQVQKARSAAAAAATSFTLLPDMLGAHGARTYLLVIQNPAEIRSTGGLPGSLALLRADNGAVTMGWQGSAGDINRSVGGAAVVKLPKDTLNQYGPTVATDIRDAYFTPDFPVAAQISRIMVQRARGGTIDGVISIDPIALAGLIAGTGPIQVGNGITLNASNAASTLLNQTYQAIQDPTGQDTFFQQVARKVFDAVVGGQGDQQLAIKALATAAGEHRVLIWSAHPAEQQRLTGTAVAGDISGAGSSVAHVGMYFNDSVAGKPEYYLQYRSAASAVDCRKDGSQDLRVSMMLTSTVPKDFKNISVYILGDGSFAPRGTIATNLRIYAPAGGQITGLMVDGVIHSVTSDLHEGRQVALLPIALKPGQQMALAIDLQTGKGQSSDSVLDFTPGMIPVPNGVRIASAC